MVCAFWYVGEILLRKKKTILWFSAEAEQQALAFQISQPTKPSMGETFFLQLLQLPACTLCVKQFAH
jgi:hypothetical protein